MSGILSFPRKLKLTKSSNSTNRSLEQNFPEECDEKEASESIHEVEVSWTVRYKDNLKRKCTLCPFKECDWLRLIIQPMKIL